jgi:hypothetical protein
MTAISDATWNMTVLRRDLIDAIGTARRRATLKRRGFELEKDVIFASSDDGLSIRSSNAAMDIPGSGSWTSPIAANGATLRRLAPALDGSEIKLSYCDGQLALNTTRISAREL